MKKQYIILAVAIVLLVISLVFLPFLGQILFIPFIYIFRYACRSSNRQRQEQVQQQLEQNPHNNPDIFVPIQKRNESNEKICEICGAKISQPNIRFCESCGAKLN